MAEAQAAETIQQPTRTTDADAVLTKGLQELT